MSVQAVNEAKYEELIRSGATVLLDFYADWCGPCRMVSPLVDEIAEERTDVLVGKINVDDDPSLAMDFGVVSIPTLVVVRHGEAVMRAVGARPKDAILAMLDA